MNTLPESFQSEAELENFISEPPQTLLENADLFSGTTAILGIAGKMGIDLGLMLKKTLEKTGSQGKIIGVSRFSDSQLRNKLEESGIKTVACDLMDNAQIETLPQADRVVYMAGKKFGTTGNEALTWAMNALPPVAVCRRYTGSPIVAFSTGAVYPHTPVHTGGCTENTPLEPIGEYANAAVARERIFSWASEKFNTPLCLIRLFYSNDLRYGVLKDIAGKVFREETLDVSMGHVNLIWQGDAVAQALLSFPHTSLPASALNVTGPETVSVRYLAARFGELFGKNRYWRAKALKLHSWAIPAGPNVYSDILR